MQIRGRLLAGLNIHLEPENNIMTLLVSFLQRKWLDLSPTCRGFSSWSSSWLHQSISTCLGCRKAQRCEGRGCRNHRPCWWEPPGSESTPPVRNKENTDEDKRALWVQRSLIVKGRVSRRVRASWSLLFLYHWQLHVADACFQLKNFTFSAMHNPHL